MLTLLSQSSTRKSARGKPAAVQPEEDQGLSGAKEAKAARRSVGMQAPGVEGAKRVEQKKAPKKVKPTFAVPSLYWRLAITGALTPLLLGGIFLTSGKLKTLAGEVEQKRGQLVALSERETSFKELAADLAAFGKELPLIEKALPNEERVIDFLGEVQKVREESEVTLTAFSFESDQPKADSKGNNYIELRLGVEGPLINLKNFLEKLLNLPILLKIKTIDASKMDEETSRLVLRAWLYVDPDFFLK